MIKGIVEFFTGLSMQTWIIIAAVAAFGIWTYKVYDAGYDKADAIWRAKNLEARIEVLEREKFTQLIADEADEKSDAEMKRELDEWKQKAEEYEKQLEARPDAERCVLTDDDINGMP